MTTLMIILKGKKTKDWYIIKRSVVPKIGDKINVNNHEDSTEEGLVKVIDLIYDHPNEDCVSVFVEKLNIGVGKYLDNNGY